MLDDFGGFGLKLKLMKAEPECMQNQEQSVDNLNEAPNFAESFLCFILLFYYIALICITSI